MALNPITYTEKVVGDFLRYQLTTYPDLQQDVRRSHATLPWEARKPQ
jgi:hypothetical protein